MTTNNMISVIIPNLNSPIIDQTVKSLLHQNTALPFEIIIVGMDKFEIIVNIEDKHVKFMKTEKPTPPSIARNMGAAAARGDYFVFIDADCIADKKLLEQHVEAHHGTQDRLVGGAVSLSKNKNYWILADNIATFHEVLLHTKPGTREILPSLNLSISKVLWNKLEGFDPSFPSAAGEDADFSYRARKLGAEILFTPHAVLEHHHQRGSLKALLKHAYTFGMYSMKFNPKYHPRSRTTNLINRYPFALILLSPIIALVVIFKIIFIEKLPLHYWHTLPAVYISKIAWCFGARRRILKSNPEI